MTDDEIIKKLNSEHVGESPLEIIELIKYLKQEKLTQFNLIMLFFRAFELPLGVCIDISVTRRLFDSGLSDEHVLETLKPWLPLRPRQTPIHAGKPNVDFET